LEFPVTVLRAPIFVGAGMLFWHSRFFEMVFPAITDAIEDEDTLFVTCTFPMTWLIIRRHAY
jgi:hypothetical protein